jgi:nucleoside-diphosphate-sugar epimerase
MKHIGILGLGWLGKPLAECLQQKGFKVKGTTTTLSKKVQLKAEGFEAFHLLCESDRIEGENQLFFKDIDLLIINIPPKIAKDDASSYVTKIKLLLAEIQSHPIKKVIYISSTGVFEDANNFPIYTEKTTPNAKTTKALQLIEAENLVLNISRVETVVIRFGGLVGNERHPIFYLSGKSNLGNPLAPVNLIHLEDCIHLIHSIIQKNEFNQIFHGVHTIDKPKAKFYTLSATKRNLTVPIFNNDSNEGKKISAESTKVKLQLQLKRSVQ